VPLLPFQAESVEKLHTKKSRLIGDEPGLGKTYQALAIDQLNRSGRGHPKVEVPAKPKTLIIAPKTVVGVWDQHCMDLTEEDVFVIDPKNRHIIAREMLNKNNSGYFIVNWDALRLMPEIAKVNWFHIIGDEIHRIKNHKGQATRALLKVRTEYKSGLSGTPADDKPQDLWQVLNWLWPKFYTNRWKFIEAYCGIETHDPNTGEAYGYRKIVGVNKDRIPHLHEQMAPWYVRRKKEDVLEDLPEKYYSRLYVELTPTQRRAYNAMKKTMVAWVAEHEGDIENPVIAQAAVSQLVRLQQYASGTVVPELDEDGNHKYVWKWKYPPGLSYQEKMAFKAEWAPTEEDPMRPLLADPPAKQQWLFEVVDPSSKLDAVMEFLDDRDLDKQPVIIMSRFKSIIKLLNKRLEKADITYGCITGDVKQDMRTSQVKDFQDGKLQVFTGTIAAMREGITLHRASTVIFIDRVWNPSWNTQAEDRAHRIGQVNAVQIIDIIARNTVDLGQLQKIAMKLKYLQMLLGDTVNIKWFEQYDVIGSVDFELEEEEEVA
jgi:SNF2 family DNA or RNA helicase